MNKINDLKYYFDITILEQPDINRNHLLSSIFMFLHNTFVKQEFKDQNIAISFPNYIYAVSNINKEKLPQEILREKFIIDKNPSGNGGVSTIGNTIRVFCSEQQVLKNLINCLDNFSEYVRFTCVNIVPENTEHRVVKRVNPKNFTKKNESINKGSIKERRSRVFELPYVKIYSSSSKKSFNIFVTVSTKVPKQNGAFNKYGLSANGSTVPWF